MLVNCVQDASSSWNSVMNMTAEEIKSELVIKYKNSMHLANAKEKIREMKKSVSQFVKGHLCSHIYVASVSLLH